MSSSLAPENLPCVHVVEGAGGLSRPRRWGVAPAAHLLLSVGEQFPPCLSHWGCGGLLQPLRDKQKETDRPKARSLARVFWTIVFTRLRTRPSDAFGLHRNEHLRHDDMMMDIPGQVAGADETGHPLHYRPRKNSVHIAYQSLDSIMAKT